MEQIRFIHAADLHLDSPFTGLGRLLPDYLMKEIRESPFRSFQRIVRTALKENVDFVILAGDLFDGENRSLRTQVRLREEMQILREADIPVYIIHGNHDHLGGSWTKIDLPDNVHVFGPETSVKRFEKKGTAVHLYGFSYPRRHVPERMAGTYEKLEGADYHIGLLHGSAEGSSGHSPYAPFSAAELAEKGFDYWALGHIHIHSVVSEEPLAVYPGNIQGRNRKESGPKGCCLVELNGRDADYSFVETAGFIWENKKIHTYGHTADTLLETMRRELAGGMADAGGRMIHFELACNEGEWAEQALSDILDLLQEEAEMAESFRWPVGIRAVPLADTGSPANRDTPFFRELREKAASFTEFDDVLKPLYRHAGLRKHLEPLGQDEKKQLLGEAEAMLIRLL